MLVNYDIVPFACRCRMEGHSFAACRMAINAVIPGTAGAPTPATSKMHEHEEEVESQAGEHERPHALPAQGNDQTKVAMSPRQPHTREAKKEEYVG